jgi:putative nucleotidyltransferase with HDIG domain
MPAKPSNPDEPTNTDAPTNAAAGGLQLVTTNANAPRPGSSVPDWPMQRILEAAGELAALPHVVLRLIQMTNDPTVTAGDLEKVILTDQAVAARVLALANSAYFGLPRKVFFVREAVVFLGFKTVRNLAMTVNAINMFLGMSDALSVARGQLWHHSLDVALTSRKVAEYLHKSDRADMNAEEAFTAGLLHDIGKMVLDIAMPERYLAAVKLVNERGVRFADIEDKLFPFTHAAVGAALAETWNLPNILCDALRYHHDPIRAEINPHLVAAVSLGNEITDYLTKLVDGPEQVAETATAIHNQACDMLCIRPDELPDLILACQAELEKGITLHGCV